MRAIKFLLFGILLVLTGAYTPAAVAGLLYTNAGTLNPVLGANSLYIFWAQAILIGLGFLIGLIGLFQRDPVPPVVNLPYTLPPQTSQVPQETLPPDFR